MASNLPDWVSQVEGSGQGAAPAAAAPALPAWVTQVETPPRSPPKQAVQAGPLLGPWSSAVVRPLAKGVAALPLMAMDAGVASRNLLGDATNWALGKPATPDYTLPSAMFNQSLDSLTTKPQDALNQGAEFVSSSLAGSRLPAPTMEGGAPPGFIPSKGLLRNQVLAEGQKAGYVVPPSSANPTFLNRLLEGIGGKIKLQQEAALRNQSVTDREMTQSVGESPEAPVTQGALQTIRKNAAQSGYGPVRKIGMINTDPKYGAAVDAIEKAAQPGKLLSSLKPSTEVSDLVKSLRQPSFDSNDAVDTIQYLRQAADDAFRGGTAALGRAYKSAAGAIEDQIERHLQGLGKDGQATLAAFRNQRQLIAKTYTAGKALTESGNFNARTVASELARKPLTGGQRMVGRFASTFPKATQLTQESFPAISPLDAYGSAIAGAASHSLGPLAIPLTRVGIRQYLLSPAGQSRALTQPFSAPKNMGSLASLLLQSGLLNRPSTAP